MHRSLVIAGYLAGAAILSANVDEQRPSSSAHEVLHREFTYAPPAVSSPPEAAHIPVTGPVVEMTPFRVEEMRPRHTREVEANWAQRERLRPKALIVKTLGRVQLVAFETPYLYEGPTPASSSKAGGVMLTVPLVSLRW